MEHSMDISSREMSQANTHLSKKEIDLREALLQLQRANQELHATHQQLIQKEKLASIGQLAAGVAHEINNPLSFVATNMHVLEKYVDDFARIFAYLESFTDVDKSDERAVQAYFDGLKQLKKEVRLDHISQDINVLLEETADGMDRVKKIVDDLRTFAREDRGEMTEVHLEEVIDRSLSIASNEVKYKARVYKDYAENLPLVRCSEHRLGQVFVNLIVNAAQAMEDRGDIRIRTYEQDEHVYVDVSDNGQGISQGDLLKIFDPFFTTKPVGQGTGLGLSVCHEIIKNHGGDIKVTSEENKGTTFLIKLPAATRIAPSESVAGKGA